MGSVSTMAKRGGIMHEWSFRVKSVRTAPPGYDTPTCTGATCFVIDGRLLIPGATYGDDTSFDDIWGFDVRGSGPVMGILRNSGNLMLEFSSNAERDSVAATLAKLSGIGLMRE
jgi:hypothetical protein